MIAHKIGLRNWRFRLESFFSFTLVLGATTGAIETSFPASSNGVSVSHVLGSKRGNQTSDIGVYQPGSRRLSGTVRVRNRKSLGVCYALFSQAKRQSTFSKWSRWRLGLLIVHGVWEFFSTDFQHRISTPSTPPTLFFISTRTQKRYCP